MSSFAEEVNPIEIPTYLLKKKKLKPINPLETNYVYDKVGTNDYVIVEPSVIKFEGFETMKLNLKKIKVINNSTKSQRVHILPPGSPFFRVHFNKKGSLAPGIAEEIAIHFCPSEYRYFYDCLRIHTEDENILVPIHAYPVLDRKKLRSIFPKLIDFGIQVLGSRKVYRFPIECKIPVNFEFEFKIKKDHPDLKISPLKGLIPGKSYIEVEIEYYARKASTAILEAELFISQFSFKPLKIRIMGSGKYKGYELEDNQTPVKTTKGFGVGRETVTNQNDMQETADDFGEKRTKKRDFKVRRGKRSVRRRNSHILKTEGNEEKGEKTIDSKSVKSVNIAPGQLRKSRPASRREIRRLKKSKRKTEEAKKKEEKGSLLKSDLEKLFLERFNNIYTLTKNKEIKMFRCIGDPQPGENDINNIILQRQEFNQKELEKIREDGVHRYEKIIDGDLPIYEPILPYYEPSGDEHKNNANKLRKMRLAKFMRVATKIILRIRVDKRINRIKSYLGEAKNKQEVQQLVKEDWQRADYLGTGKADFVKFDFDFNQVSIGTNALHIQYDNKIDQINEKYNATPTIGFDDLSHIDDLKFNDAEFLDYRPLNPFEIHLYHPVMIDAVYRRGAEQQYPTTDKLGPCGDLTQNIDDKIIFSNIPSNVTLPPDVPSDKCLHPQEQMRRLYELQEVTETDPSFMLRWEKMEYLNVLKPKEGDNVDDLLYEYMATTPGYDCLRYLNQVNIEFSYYYRKRVNLPDDIFSEKKLEKYCPDIMYAKEKDDELSDDDSDDENAVFELENKNIDDFNVEDIDEEFKEKLNKFEEGIIDEREEIWKNLNKNFEKEKTKNLAILPTMTSDYNKYLNFPNNKLFVI